MLALCVSYFTKLPAEALDRSTVSLLEVLQIPEQYKPRPRLLFDARQAGMYDSIASKLLGSSARYAKAKLGSFSPASPTGMSHLEGLIAWHDICQRAIDDAVCQRDDGSDRHLESVSEAKAGVIGRSRRLR
jgi:hypothetical protein